MTRPLTLSLLLAAVALAGCGRMGELERPGAAASADGDIATAPVNAPDGVHRDNDPAPPRTLPIEGGPSNPGSLAPPGALPNPYADPK